MLKKKTQAKSSQVGKIFTTIKDNGQISLLYWQILQIKKKKTTPTIQ